MIIENFSVPATYWGFSVQENAELGLVGAAAAGLVNVPAGTFGMKFLLANPVLAALAMLPPIAGLSGAMISYIHKMGALVMREIALPRRSNGPQPPAMRTVIR